MYIIFGEPAAAEIGKTSIVLEVDTIRIMPANVTAKSYCVLEPISNIDPDRLESYKKIHADLLEQYRAQNWNYCLQAAKDLHGAWGGQLDEFYINLVKRVVHYSSNPQDNWDYAVVKEVVPEN